MSHVSIKNFNDVGDPGAPIGSPEWCKAAHHELCATKRQTDWEVRHLKYGLLEFKKAARWQNLQDGEGQPFVSWEAYVQCPEPHGLGLPTESVKLVIEALNDNALLGEVLLRAGPGRPPLKDVREREGSNNGSNTTINETIGRGRNYTVARLRKESRDDLAERVVKGELSANAAAIEAGFRKKLTPFETVMKLIPKLSASERRKVKAAL
jgi:hypothetical protein